ncbi:MAG TPA: DUF2284 domain-containing protein [Synergistales bacterium]|nr:DUF2284 domain-containing protein [Synergistales bacterium]HPC76298.1 DUF2284 domain-containing protein [Synergistales bacterium]HRU91104.1 DUF2284 domain-containing protein [Thermovirgaceae bacterium]
MNEDAAAGVTRILAEAGFHDHQWVQPSELVVSQWVRAKCMFGCPDYGRNASCPPHVPSVPECREFLREYSRALLIHLSCRVPPEGRRQWCLENQERLIEAERRVFLSGFEKAFLLSFDNCNLCEECVAEPSDCRLPYKRRPTMEAFAIDVYSSVKKYGYTLSVKKDRLEEPDRFALLLVE